MGVYPYAYQLEYVAHWPMLQDYKALLRKFTLIIIIIMKSLDFSCLSS